MSTFVPGETYPTSAVDAAVRPSTRAGPFLFGREGAAVVVALGDGPEDASFPDRRTLRWPGEAPRRRLEHCGTVLAFVERGTDRLEFIGEARPVQYSLAGARVRDVHLRLRSPRPRAAWLRDLGARLPGGGGPPPEAELAALAPDAAPERRWAALETFVSRWHGAPVPPSAAGGANVGPPLLRRMLDLAAGIPALVTHNHLVAARELAVEDGRLAFLYENQGVCLWATEPEGADPPVWYRVNRPSAPWIEEPERLSGFLVQVVLFDASMHAPYGAYVAGADGAVRDAVLARVDPLAQGRWTWLGARFHARSGALVMTMENGDGFDLYLAASTPRALDAFEDLVTPDWDWIAF